MIEEIEGQLLMKRNLKKEYYETNIKLNIFKIMYPDIVKNLKIDRSIRNYRIEISRSNQISCLSNTEIRFVENFSQGTLIDEYLNLNSKLLELKIKLQN